ncbi:hypothetical protein HYPSUDRAFT_191052 [Hypholoma sublateritium FD-334 SS-4]|uniref:G-protein coupled receptors family 1 profile domain-containing protein n=1 Tax=Hypholoma sublateritium (strain FD-334 SS-4) TaxID=945553 RepID=A0A0D2M580_HYPSF|nr:hypothetical protein HYPSUDRAFT_191052 [Hypholoma sublateritium FD-334 SS-4]
MSCPNLTDFPPHQLIPAFVILEEANDTVTANYAAVGSLAFLVRDILDNIVSDYHFFKSGLNVPLLAYFTSRIAAVGYLLGSVIFTSVPIGHCTLLHKIVTSCSSVAFACTALLFFLRLRAIYNRNRVVVAIFFFFWLILLAAVIPFNTTGAEVGSTKYCSFTSGGFTPSFTVNLTPLLYDTLVFFAISWRLCRLSCAKPSGPRESLKLLIFGKYLPAFTKSLYLDGQVYYLTTLITGISIFLSIIPAIPITLKLLLWSPYVVLVNIMACRVYRRTRMGTIRESEISTAAIGRAAIPVIHPIMFNHNYSTTSLSDVHVTTRHTTTPHINSHHDAMGTVVERRSLV